MTKQYKQNINSKKYYVFNNLVTFLPQYICNLFICIYLLFTYLYVSPHIAFNNFSFHIEDFDQTDVENIQRGEVLFQAFKLKKESKQYQ